MQSAGAKWQAKCLTVRVLHKCSSVSHQYKLHMQLLLIAEASQSYPWMQGCIQNVIGIRAGAVLGIFIWVGQSKAKQILSRPTGVVYVGIIGMIRAVWVGHGLLGLIARTASAYRIHPFGVDR